MICLVYFSLWLELKECMKSILILFFLTFILTVKKKTIPNVTWPTKAVTK